MKYLILACALLLGSCARHNSPAPPKSEPIGAAQSAKDTEFVRINSTNLAENGPSRRLDSVVVAPHRTVLDKLLGRKPTSKVASSLPVKVGKKSTVSVYYGPATVTTTTVGKKATAATAEGATATTIGKVKAPTALGDSAVATDNTKAGQRGGAVAIGPGATATATTVKPGLPWARIAAGVVGGGFVIWVLFFGGGATLLALWRKNKPTQNQA